MTTTGIRGIRRKKSTLSEVKLVVFGAPAVGKSAVTVRFLTKRYIGEYDHQGDKKYKHEVLVDNDPVIFEIKDVCCSSKTDPSEMPPQDLIQWADAFVLVYSITDRQSFSFVKQVRQYLGERRVVLGSSTGACIPSGSSPSASTSSLSISFPTSLASTSSFSLMLGGGSASPNSSSGTSATPAVPTNTNPLPIAVIGNKGDMVHLRQVSTEEGEILSKDCDCLFAEVAASEQVTEVADVFLELCREIHVQKKKSKQSLLDRMLGSKATGALKAYSRGKSDSALPKD